LIFATVRAKLPAMTTRDQRHLLALLLLAAAGAALAHDPPRPGPADPAPPPTILEGEVGGLKYLEVVPGHVAPEGRLPMLVAIHGLGSHPRHFLRAFQGLREPVRLILPQGPTPHRNGFSWFPLARADAGADLGPMEAGIRASAARIARLLATLVPARPTVGKPIVTGFSQGGMLSFALALHHPEVVGLAIPVAGFLPPGLLPGTRPAGARIPPIVALHGQADRRIKIDWVRAGVADLARAGIPVTLYEYPRVGHQLHGQMVQELFARIGVGLAEAAGDGER